MIVFDLIPTQKAQGPEGWRDFVKKQSAAPYKPEEMQAAFKKVKDTWQYQSDIRYHGLVDHWTEGQGGIGDCEDFAAACKHELLLRGFSPYAMAFATCFADGERHAGLILKTEKGPYVFDVLSNEPMPWQKLAYTGWLVEWPGLEWAMVKEPVTASRATE